MDIRYEPIRDCFFDTCKRQGMLNVAPVSLVPPHDDTVYFTSSTITGLKSMVLNDQIPVNGVYLHQPCFRLHSIHEPFYDGEKIKYPGYFNMLGVLVPADSILNLQHTIIDIMDNQGIDRNKIKLNTTAKEPMLVQELKSYYEVEYDTRQPKSYDWTYGMGQDITGTGMTFYIRQDTGEYKRLGQYIIIYNKGKPIAAEYGCGIEVFLARTQNYKNEYDAFSIAPILHKNGRSVDFANEHVFSSVAAAYSTGMSLKNNPSKGYKKNLLCIIRNLLLLKERDKLSNEQILNILKQYTMVEFGDDKFVATIMQDLYQQEQELMVQKSRAEAFLANPYNRTKTPSEMEAKLQELYPFYIRYQNTLNQNQKARI